MNIALWLIGILALSMGTIAAVAWSSINRGGDNFGAGIVWLLVCGIAGIAAFVWIILAAVHWWPK